MRDSGTSKRGPVEETQAPKSRKAKLERLSSDITKRRKVEQALRESEEKYRGLFEGAGDAIFLAEVHGQDLRFVDCNSCALKMFVGSREELIGKSPFDVSPAFQPDGIPSKEKGFKQILRVLRGESPSFEWRHCRLDGTPFDTEVTMNHLELGGKHCVQGIVRDITDRKRLEKELKVTHQQLRATEAELREEHKFLSHVFESLSHPFYVIDANDYTIKLANRAANLGTLTQDSTCYALTHKRRKPCEGAEYPCPLQEVKKTKEPVTVEHIHYDKDGNCRNVEVHAHPIFDSDGNVSGIIEYCLDITERKRADEALREKQHLNELLLNSIPHPAMLINTKRIVQAANKIAFDIGVKLGDYCWKTFGRCEYLSDENKERAEENPDDERIKCTFCLADEAMKGPELKKMNDPEVHMFGKIWDTYWDPIDKEIFLHYAIDVTERKKAEEVIAKLAKFPGEDPNPVLRISAYGTVSYANKASLSLLKVWRCQVGESLPNPWYDCILHALSSGRSQQAETQCDGRTFSLIFAPVVDSNYVNIYGLDITSRKRAERQLERQSALLDGINRVLREALTCETDMDVARTCLAVAEELTGSKFGFIGEVNQEGLLDTIAVSNPGWDACKMPKSKAVKVLRDMEIRGLWSRVLKHEQSQIVNEPGSDPDRVGVPEGHPLITRFMGVPLRHGGKTFGLIGLGNKKSGYEPADQEAVEKLSVSFVEALMRKRVEGAMRSSEERLKILFERAPDAVYLSDVEGKFVDGNRAAEELTGYKREELIGKDFAEAGLLSAEQIAIAVGALKRAASREPTGPDEYTLTRKDGGHVTVEIRTYPVRIENKILSLGIARDVTERRRSQDKIEASLKEKEVLLKEIHHRVKNNMQVMSSILNLQARHIKDEETLRVFKSSQSRIKSMALVHEKLYESEDLAMVSFADYVRSVISHLVRSYGIGRHIRLDLDIKDISLDIDMAIPCGLIINELISNALKYAFPNGREGEIRVRLLSHEDGKFTLTVKDNGIGFPKDLDFRRTESLGMQLVIMLVEQLDGTIELEKGKGTAFKITFEKRESGGKRQQSDRR